MIRYFFALFVMILSANANAQVVVTVSDYPRHATTLSQTQQDSVRQFARAIVGALIAGQDVNVSVHGHADFDALGRDFELKVSRERAENALNLLRQLITEEGATLPPARLQSVQILAVGNGTLKPVFPRPKNESERKANRRVDFITTVVAPTPPVPQSVFERCRKTIAAGAPPGPTRRMTCLCTKLEQAVPRVQDTTYDFAASRRIPGSAGFPNMTPAQWDVAIRSIAIHQRQDLKQASANAATDADFHRQLLNIDDMIGLNINNFQNTATGGKAQGVFDRLMLADITGRMADPNHVYSCYAGYSRVRHDQ
jgi:hypothetical protein